MMVGYGAVVLKLLLQILRKVGGGDGNMGNWGMCGRSGNAHPSHFPAFLPLPSWATDHFSPR